MKANSNIPVIGYKQCSSCERVLPVSQFRVTVETRPGKGTLHTTRRCLACENEYKREFSARKRQREQWERLLASVGTPPCDTCFRRERCAKDPIPCYRFDAYVEGVSIPEKSESPDRDQLSGLSIND